MTNNTVQIRKKGNFTLPMDFRSKYGVDEGDIFTLIDMGDDDPEVSRRSGLRLGTPGDALAWVRDQLSKP